MIRWPGGGFQGGRDVENLSAHIDIFPTLAEICHLDYTPVKTLDGRSLVPLLSGHPESWDDRILIIDSQRLQNLVKWRKSAVMERHWRLVDGREHRC